MFRQDCTCPALLESLASVLSIRGCHPLRRVVPDASGCLKIITGLVRFRSASTYRLKLAAQINSLTHYTRGTRSPPKGAPTACRHPVSGPLSLPSSGCFSPFPHGTRPLSVTKEYLGLEGGPPIFRQDCTCPALLEDERSLDPYGTGHPLRFRFQTDSGCLAFVAGLVRVRSPLLAESRLMSFPPGTEMFQFPGFA